MSTVAHIDSEAVEVGQEIAPLEQHGLFRTDDPLEVLERAARVADTLRDVLRKQGLVQKIQGKEHVLVEGWTLLGAMLGVTAICVESEPVDGGYKATVEARTGNGVVVGRADAVCTKHEKRGPWKSADDYARLSMAQTRATSKALKGPLGFVVSLAGFAATPAEEMHGVQEPNVPVHVAQMVNADSGVLTPPAREKVLKAIIDAGQEPALVLAAIGAEPNGDLTLSEAKRIRQILDAA